MTHGARAPVEGADLRELRIEERIRGPRARAGRGARRAGAQSQPMSWAVRMAAMRLSAPTLPMALDR